MASETQNVLTTEMGDTNPNHDRNSYETKAYFLLCRCLGTSREEVFVLLGRKTKELNLSYHNKETTLLTKDPFYVPTVDGQNPALPIIRNIP